MSSKKTTVTAKKASRILSEQQRIDTEKTLREVHQTYLIDTNCHINCLKSLYISMNSPQYSEDNFQKTWEGLEALPLRYQSTCSRIAELTFKPGLLVYLFNLSTQKITIQETTFIYFLMGKKTKYFRDFMANHFKARLSP